MSYVLAIRKGEWLLAAFAPNLRGCNLSTVRPPLHDRERYHIWNKSVYVWSHAPLDGITFFPELKYQGCKVYPWHGWRHDSAEPILSCLIGDLRASPDETADDVRARRERLVAQGWEDGGRDGVAGYVHVDDIEKFEGPPPDGPF